MKSTIKIVILAGAIILFLCFCFLLTKCLNTISVDNLCVLKAEAINIDSTRKLLSFETEDGNIFQIKDIDDWKVGDKVIIVFDNQKTQDVKDDKIIKVFHNG